MTESFARWRVVKRRDTGTWIAIHPVWGVRGVVRTWGAAFGIAYRAARKEMERERSTA